MRPTDIFKATSTFPLKMIGVGSKRLFQQWALTEKSGAQLAKPKKQKDFIGKHHKGALVDGHCLRLSEDETSKNIVVIARTGAGKTSRNIIPNVLAKRNSEASIIINDPRGEVFAATSAAMQDGGYTIIVINPADPEVSARFNPLAEARDDIELEQIAEIIVKAGNPHDKDAFWNAGATRLVSVLLKALRNLERATGQPVLTLANLTFLLQNFGADGSPINDWMANASIDPDDPHDASLWNEWKGALTGNPEGVQSFVLNALTALRAMSNRNLAWMTSASDFSLQDMRRKKTCLYFVTPAQHQDYYSFLISVFFRSVFNAAMRQMPGKSDLPWHMLCDEFAHSTLPGFVSTANTIRAYKCSLTIVLQSISQLADRYGRETAYAIQGGFNTAMTYPGADPQTAQFFEGIAGKVRERQKESWTRHTDQYREYNLLNASEVRTLPADTALLVSANRQPLLLKTKPYFAVPHFAALANKGPARLPRRRVDMSGVARITL